MVVHLEDIGKRFQKEWIFRHVQLTFHSSQKYVLIGHNGSGKSTLLQIISGILIPTEGRVKVGFETLPGDVEDASSLFSFSAPYQELPEELTAQELIEFHGRFKSLRKGMNVSSFFEKIELKGQETKQIKFFSSGMRQRLKLGLCAFTDAEAYFFDEPTTNLDENGATWYRNMIHDPFFEDKLVIVSSNLSSEYENFNTIINIVGFK